VERTEQAVVRAINSARRRHGLRGLRLVERISDVAAAHSQDEVTHHSLSHSSSDGTPFYTRIRQAAGGNAVGETLIAYRGHFSARAIVRAWMLSPPHRQELLSGSYRRIGIGRATLHGTSVVTADFAS
jgi:uncharacterized protein YkwD